MNSAKQAAFTALVEGLAPDLFRYAYWLCGDRELAKDLIQETYLRAWKSLDSLQQAERARSWLFTILRRENARHFSRRRPAPAAPYEIDIMVAKPEYDTSTEAFVLRRALAILDPKYREPLVLQVVGGFSCEEIAAILGLSTTAVMTRLFRARKQLKGTLQDARQKTNRVAP